METPVKVVGTMGIEVSKASWEDMKGKTLSIWATVENPRNAAKNVGVRCQVQDAGNNFKSDIQNFYGADKNLDSQNPDGFR